MGGIIGGLFLAWILSLFGIHNIIIAGIEDLFNVYISIPGYYVLFAIIGLITDLFAKRK